MKDLATRIVDTMGEVHGVHSGFRSVHAKGRCCRGKFFPSPEAASLCIAPHFQQEATPVTVRFSNGSGKPTRADGAKDERGMAVKFHLGDGTSTDIVCLTLPVFFVKTPEHFLEFLEAQRPDPETGKPNLDRVAEFVASHPEAQTAVGFLMFSMSPASFANCTFFGIHAFQMTDPDGVQRYVRYRWVPAAGDATLTDDETRALGRDYLGEELEERLAAGPMEWDLRLQIASDLDDPNDPTTAWPETRELVTVGRMIVDQYAGNDCEAMIFDPTRVVEGVECSDDPILNVRSAAYSISFERRSATRV